MTYTSCPRPMDGPRQLFKGTLAANCLYANPRRGLPKAKARSTAGQHRAVSRWRVNPMPFDSS